MIQARFSAGRAAHCRQDTSPSVITFDCMGPLNESPVTSQLQAARASRMIYDGAVHALPRIDIQCGKSTAISFSPLNASSIAFCG